ncbi:hypothetical protein [Candidatus Methylomirabilis sp.]|uniref:hypothetical protein n=1 Tax=Candidatus Methylomirabilis sp. TaxID=2032687 RepID=UPI002A6863B0|nr:hypothetical protein [Candidatus Methylomirabilis sp.]
MENGSVWGHGAYLGPDFSAEYLHALAVAAGPALKQNRYDPRTRTLTFTDAEAATFESQVARWTAYFAEPTGSIGLPAKYITDPTSHRLQTASLFYPSLVLCVLVTQKMCRVPVTIAHEQIALDRKCPSR